MNSGGGVAVCAIVESAVFGSDTDTSVGVGKEEDELHAVATIATNKSSAAENVDVRLTVIIVRYYAYFRVEGSDNGGNKSM